MEAADPDGDGGWEMNGNDLTIGKKNKKIWKIYGFCTKKHSTGRHHLVENGASNLELWGRLHLLPRFNGLVLLGNLNWKP